jgi:hypothetical protein
MYYNWCLLGDSDGQLVNSKPGQSKSGLLSDDMTTSIRPLSAKHVSKFEHHNDNSPNLKSESSKKVPRSNTRGSAFSGQSYSSYSSQSNLSSRSSESSYSNDFEPTTPHLDDNDPWTDIHQGVDTSILMNEGRKSVESIVSDHHLEPVRKTSTNHIWRP